MATTNLVTYRRHIIEPRSIDGRFEIANSHRFSRRFDFLNIDAGDILGIFMMIISVIIFITWFYIKKSHIQKILQKLGSSCYRKEIMADFFWHFQTFYDCMIHKWKKYWQIRQVHFSQRHSFHQVERYFHWPHSGLHLELHLWCRIFYRLQNQQ